MTQRDKSAISADEMYNQIAELVREANYRNEHIVLDTFPKLRSIDDRVIMGSFGWTLVRSRQRLIHTAHANYIGGYVCTPADLARHYLSIKFPDRLRCRTSQYKAFQQRRSHPLYAKPCQLDNAAYIDIQSAYWSILQVLGWDIEYKPAFEGKRGFMGVGSSMSDWPFSGHKIARNCLVSLGIGKGMRVYDRGKFTVVKTGNKHANRGLWACIQDVLNTIAYECVSAGAVYVHTDGYIFPHDRLDEGLAIIEHWGLPSRVKHFGRARVWGTGVYDIGNHTHKARIVNPVTMMSIRPSEDSAWLKQQFSFHAVRTLKPIDNPPTVSSESIANWLVNREYDL